MRFKKRQSGLTLPEMTVVITIAALILAMTIPAVNMLMNTFESESGAKSIINAALASARSIAIKQHQYAGIRFQKRYDPIKPDPLNESQYIIFIIKGENRNISGNLDYDGFHAVDGIQPIKLPDSIGVMDFITRTNWGITPNAASFVSIGVQPINADIYIDSAPEVNDTTTLSVIFSPSGKIVIHPVRVRNRNGDYRPLTLNDSDDDIFNSPENIIYNKTGMFIQDDYANIGFGSEMSRNSFYIYEPKKLKQPLSGRRWTDYLSQVSLKPVYINPYTGTIVDER